MNRFLQYINEVLESLDINMNPNSKKIKSAAKKLSKNNQLAEK